MLQKSPLSYKENRPKVALDPTIYAHTENIYAVVGAEFIPRTVRALKSAPTSALFMNMAA